MFFYFITSYIEPLNIQHHFDDLRSAHVVNYDIDSACNFDTSRLYGFYVREYDWLYGIFLPYG